MKKPIIAGIQQIGIGIPNVHEAWSNYRQLFTQDIPIFEEAATAGLMLPYTGGQPQARHAILAINANGGGGFEIWQYTGRVPQPPVFEPQLGDLGIFVAKIKSKNVRATFLEYEKKGFNLLSVPSSSPEGSHAEHFFVKDNYNNIFEITASDSWFADSQGTTGGVYGAIIGVSDIEKARTLYSDILGYDQVIYDIEGKFDDLEGLPGAKEESFRRVLLRHSQPRQGAFSQLLGSSEIELVQALGRKPRKIYENRLWGDLGFIHLCFDISGMKEMQQLCEEKCYPFTVDSSNSFDMGEAAGHFSYVEDPDGTLIEFVETHKIPILKKVGWYLDLRKRDPSKSLPTFMLKALTLNRKK